MKDKTLNGLVLKSIETADVILSPNDKVEILAETDNHFEINSDDLAHSIYTSKDKIKRI